MNKLQEVHQEYLDLIDDRLKDPINRTIIWSFEKQDFDRFYHDTLQVYDNISEIEKDLEMSREEVYSDPLWRLTELQRRMFRYSDVAEMARLCGQDDDYKITLARRNHFEKSSVALNNYFLGLVEVSRDLLGGNLEKIVGDQNLLYFTVMDNNDIILKEVFPTKGEFVEFYNIPRQELADITAFPKNHIEELGFTDESLELKWKFIGRLIDYMNKEADRIYGK